jgi:hypothetical protein
MHMTCINFPHGQDDRSHNGETAHLIATEAPARRDGRPWRRARREHGFPFGAGRGILWRNPQLPGGTHMASTPTLTLTSVNLNSPAPGTLARF